MYDPAHAHTQLAPIVSPLFVEQSGAGTPLLPIHRLMVSGAMYQAVLPALATHYRVIVPDLRGHGRSGVLEGSHSMEQLAPAGLHPIDRTTTNGCFSNLV
jgi:pimeloyl-ACP methyl ester carboxylesterase